jgi:hypothetical protein
MRRIAAAFALLFAAATQAQVPVVVTQFVITGKKFPEGLKAEKTTAEKEIGASIARLAREKYPFFDWREQSEVTASAAKFIVTLREDVVDDTRSAFYLDYQRQLAGQWRPEAVKLGIDPLYSAGKRSKPYTDRVTLGGDVIKRLTEQLDKLHKSDFEIGFIRKVPLCACTAVVADGHTIVLHGFPWSSLKATKESVLYCDVAVRKLATDGTDFIPSGWIRLTDLEPISTWIGGHLGKIHCANADLDQWEQQRIQDALHQNRVPKIFVYVMQYDFDDSVKPAQSPDL